MAENDERMYDVMINDEGQLVVGDSIFDTIGRIALDDSQNVVYMPSNDGEQGKGLYVGFYETNGEPKVLYCSYEQKCPDFQSLLNDPKDIQPLYEEVYYLYGKQSLDEPSEEGEFKLGYCSFISYKQASSVEEAVKAKIKNNIDRFVSTPKLDNNRQDKVDAFRQKYSLDALERMTLDEYVYGNGRESETFCYWLEILLADCGSTQSGTPIKYLIYKYGNRPKTSSSIMFDNAYCWKSSLGNTAQGAFETVKGIIIKIAKTAIENKIRDIDDIDFGGNKESLTKWKIAFLYSKKPMVCIYKPEAVRYCCNRIDPSFGEVSSLGECHEFLVNNLESRGLSSWEFSAKLWNTYAGYKAIDSSADRTAEDVQNNESDESTSEDVSLETVSQDSQESLDAPALLYPESNREIPLNLIVFGAPGTGKSFFLETMKNANAETACFKRVTFYASYTYSQFVGSYRPAMDENGKDIKYEFTPGPFMEVLASALKHKGSNYVLIIEEINRAEAASVFGDMFQLLDRTNGTSTYGVSPSKDLLAWMKKEKVPYDGELKLPANLYIWATMNSADQGVFPLDTAFKRRWDFLYMPLEGDVFDSNVEYREDMTKWDSVRKDLNKWMAEKGINEDKLMGKYFLSESVCSEEMNFHEAFKSKVLMYLFEDAARAYRQKLFKAPLNTFSSVTTCFDTEGFDGVFADKVLSGKYNKPVDAILVEEVPVGVSDAE